MDIDLNEEQKMLQKSARDFLADNCKVSLFRTQLNKTGSADYPEGLWKTINNLGWAGLAFPEKYGGGNGSFLDLVVLLEEMGRVCFPSPFFTSVVLGGMTVLLGGSENQKQELLPKICSGELFITLALLEPAVTFNPSGIKLNASQNGQNYVLDGTKMFTPDVHMADMFICAARTNQLVKPEQGITLFLVDAKSRELEISPLTTIDGSKQNQVIFKEVKVPSSNIIGELNRGWDILAKVLEYAAVGKCAEMLGSAQVVLEMATQYSKERKQFDQLIGSFQVIQHYAADMLTFVDTMRLLTYEAAWMLSEGIPCSKEVSMSKSWSNEAYKKVALYGMKILGGNGFMEDHDMSLFYKKIPHYITAFGDSDFHQEVLAQKLGI